MRRHVTARLRREPGHKHSRLLFLVVTALLLAPLLASVDAFEGTRSSAAAGGINYPRIAAMEFLEGADKYPAIIGRAFWADKVLVMKQDMAAKGRSLLALRYFSPQAYHGDAIIIPP